MNTYTQAPKGPQGTYSIPYACPCTLVAPLPHKASHGSLVTPWRGPSRGHWLSDSRGVAWIPLEVSLGS